MKTLPIHRTGGLRFDIYAYDNAEDKVQEVDGIVHASDLNEAIRYATRIIKPLHFARVEIHRKGVHLASIHRNGKITIDELPLPF